MRPLAHCLVILALLLATQAGSSPLAQLWIGPDPFIWFVVFLALFTHDRAGPAPVIVAGLARDLLTIGSLGGFTLLYWIVFRYIHLRRERFFRHSKLAQVAIAGTASTFVVGCQTIALGFTAHAPPIDHTAVELLRIVLPTAVLTPFAIAALFGVYSLAGVRRTNAGDMVKP